MRNHTPLSQTIGETIATARADIERLQNVIRVTRNQIAYSQVDIVESKRILAKVSRWLKLYERGERQ